MKQISAEKSDVCLVQMPTVSLARPSLALGLLKASLEGTNISCSVTYANLIFADFIGYEAYRLLELCTWPRLGEWIFARAAFPEYNPPQERYLEDTIHFLAKADPRFSNGRKVVPEITHLICAIRAKATLFIDQLAKRLLAKKPGIVGCSSTFHQHVPSLALLRRVRELAPGVVTLIGGANCDDRMGLATVRDFPWVDVAFSGEADAVFTELCETLLVHGPNLMGKTLPEGTITKDIVRDLESSPNGSIPRATTKDLDALPVPDYSDYFDTLKASSFSAQVRPGLVMETSRGCLWAARKGCTFCGLNRREKTFRSKNPERALRELQTLSKRYRIKHIAMADNSMDPRYFKAFLPRLARLPGSYKLFYELRADVSRSQFQTLAEAGVTWVQFGIEALHDELLKLMNKGITAKANLQCLKYSVEYGIRVIWHMLYGFPGEQGSWYEETASWLPLVFHLPPPNSVLKINLNRFSAYGRNPQKYGMNLVPVSYYEKCYPPSTTCLEDLAYYLEPPDGLPEDSSGVLSLKRAIRVWKRAWERKIPPLLCMTDRDENIQIFDTRPCAPERRVTLHNLAAEIYRICDPAVTRKKLLERLWSGPWKKISKEKVFQTVEDLKKRKLLLEIHGNLFSLAMQGKIPEPVPSVDFPGGHASPPSALWFHELTGMD